MQILLVEDNPGDIRLLQEYLKEASAYRFQLTQVDRLSTGLERLAEARFDAVLLDLSLPDSQGLDTLVRLHEAAKDVPIVVLTGIEDEALGVCLVQAGAQDYLVKGQVTGPLLTRSLRYAVERNRTEAALRDSEERFRNLVEGARDVIFTLSKEGVITSLNPAFERITQWTRDAWVGQRFEALLHPEDMPLAIDLFRHIMEKGEALTAVLRIRSKERGYVVGELVGVPHVQNGQASYHQVGAVGSEWTLESTGDYLGQGKSDFLMKNANGAVVVGQTDANGQATYTQVGSVGSNWSFQGSGDFTGSGHDQYLMQNANG
ncbi:MAG: response regulator, partial [Nitrospirota bacterium]|nr:response regulator [Nitrospirota bacterium]